ncbi:MAG: type II toxin-antitoxin system RelE/ParE family toxin [Chitinophagaceae bacterium]|nr:type II toxin-antitoxin system RelE/ParE family toxin [Chitinophagaceae bacterium]
MPRFKIAYSPEALQEIKRIVEWYNEASPGLGERFKRNLLSEIAAIKKNPHTRSFR